MGLQKIIVFNGEEYVLMGGEKRYYLHKSTTTKGKVGAKGLHVAIWEFYNKKKVPKGYVIHHKDFNPFNNDIKNLECLSNVKHGKIHWEARSKSSQNRIRANMQRASEKAKEWHASEAGNKWHKEHYKNSLAKAPRYESICLHCGEKIFSTRKTPVKYCSHSCEMVHRYRNGELREKKICLECGKEFMGIKYRNARFCDRRCSAIDRERRKKRSL